MRLCGTVRDVRTPNVRGTDTKTPQRKVAGGFRAFDAGDRGALVRPGDHVVEKHTYDAFYRTELGGWLDARGADDLLICGTLANVCVLHTAASAGLRDFRPVVVTDALGYIEEEHRDYATEHADWLFGETIEREAVEFVASADAGA